jgi:hypothetical protein
MNDDSPLQAQAACGSPLYQAAGHGSDGGVRHAQPQYIGLQLGVTEGNEGKTRAPARTARDDLMERDAGGHKSSRQRATPIA